VGGSSLTGAESIPKARADLEQAGEIPNTYVPARNTIFLAYALSVAEARHIRDIYIGVNAVDYSGYPDCRPAFLTAFEQLATKATAAGIHGARFRIHAPLLEMTKADIVRLGVSLGVDFGQTWSCYDPVADGAGAVRPCRQCDACRLRRKGFDQAGMADPWEINRTHPG
jgi:7-cyano-7-deazaguanine synthase